MLGTNVKRERLYLGLSQKALRIKLGHQAKIDKIENGEIYPAVKTVYRLSKILKIEIKELLTMINFEVKPVVSDYGIFENGKLKLIVKYIGDNLRKELNDIKQEIGKKKKANKIFKIIRQFKSHKKKKKSQKQNLKI